MFLDKNPEFVLLLVNTLKEVEAGISDKMITHETSDKQKAE